MGINRKFSRMILRSLNIVILLSVTSCMGDSQAKSQDTKITDVKIPYYVKSFVKTQDIVEEEIIEKQIEEERQIEEKRIEEENIANLRPVSISIESLGEMNLLILPVGDDSQGRMDTISDGTTIAWYEKSSTPGSDGQSWLAGHKTWGGSLGTFGRIGELKNGEIVTIEYNDGSIRNFTVVNNETYVTTDVPEEYLDFSGEERTTLITCAGVYDASRGGSQSRTLVTLKKIDE